MAADAALNAARSPARRRCLGAGAGLLALRLLPVHAASGPLAVIPPSLEGTVRGLTGGAMLSPGGVGIEVAELVENGNAVPLRLTLLDRPGHGQDPVVGLWVLSESNPAREVVTLRWPGGLPAGGAVATRIRLATSQALLALAQTRGGSWWWVRAEVIVTLAACIEG